jgi:hypothetical protein
MIIWINLKTLLYNIFFKYIKAFIPILCTVQMNFKYGALLLLLISCGGYANAKPINNININININEPLSPSLNCDNEYIELYVEYTKNNTGNATCTLCHLMVNIVDAEIKHGNHTIIEITDLIKDVCSLISGPGGQTCLYIIKNIQNIVEWITHGMTNTQICSKLHLCNTTKISTLDY